MRSASWPLSASPAFTRATSSSALATGGERAAVAAVCLPWPPRDAEIPVRLMCPSAEIAGIHEPNQDAWSSQPAPHYCFVGRPDPFYLLNHLTAHVRFPIAEEGPGNTTAEARLLSKPHDSSRLPGGASRVAQNLHNPSVVRQVNTADGNGGRWKYPSVDVGLNPPNDPK